MSDGGGPEPEKGSNADDAFVRVDPAADAAAQADELLMHGMLAALHERAGGASERRVRRVLGELRESTAGQSTAGQSTARGGRWAGRPAGRRLRRVVGVPLMAMAIVIGSWAVFEWPAQQARAAVMASVSAVNGPGSRRYEVRLMRGLDTKLSEKPEAVFDSHDGGDYLLRARVPVGGVVIAGQDAAGEWAIRREGGIERDDPRRAWPRWSTDRGESLLAEPVGALMKSLARDYRLRDHGWEEREGKRLRRITAMRRGGTPPHLADRVELLIDADSRLLERMEMNWDRPRGPEVGAGPRPGMGPRGPRPDGEEFRGMGRDDQGPMGRALDRPPPGDGVDGGDGRPGGRAGPRGELGPPPERGPGMGPAMGPAMGPGMGPGPNPGPGMGPGVGMAKAIRQLVIQRVEAPVWPANWFTPEAHLAGTWGEGE